MKDIKIKKFYMYFHIIYRYPTIKYICIVRYASNIAPVCFDYDI